MSRATGEGRCAAREATRQEGPRLHGDEAELFRHHHRVLLRHVRRRAPWVAEAIVEDACLFAWLQLVRCQPDRDHVRAWLCAVARHEAWRLGHQAGRAASLDAPVKVEGTDNDPGRFGSMVETIAGRDTVEEAHAAREALRALASLPDKQRRYLALKVAGYSYREICALTGASYTNVNRHLTRARARLRKARAE